MRSLVIGSSGGIGAALVQALALRGDVIGVSRSIDGLDVTDEASILRVLGALTGTFDLIFVASGALDIGGQRPEKSLRALDAVAMAQQFAVNAIGPALVLKHCIRLMPRDRPCHFSALSARVGSIGDNALGGWYSYRAAKAALNQLIHTAAIEVARSHPLAVVTVLHPGTVATGFTKDYVANRMTVTPDQAATNLIAVSEGLTAADTGGFFDAMGSRILW